MKELPTLPPIFDEEDALYPSERDCSEARRILPVDTDLQIAELCYSGSYGDSCEVGTPFLVKDGRRHQVEPLPVPAF